MLAAESGHHEVVKRLLEAQADPNLKNKASVWDWAGTLPHLK